MNTQYERILLVWIGRFGDLLVSTPFISAVRQKHPQAEIVLLVRDYVARLAHLIPGVDKVLVMPDLKSPGAVFSFAGNYIFENFDLCVDLNSSYSRTSGFLVRLSGAEERVSFDKYRANWFYTATIPAPADTEHMMARYERLAAYFQAPFTPKMNIGLPKEDLAEAERLFRAYKINRDRIKIVFHAGNFKKFDHRWPEDNFIALAEKVLARPDTELYFIAGKGEDDKTEKLARKLSRPVRTFWDMTAGVTAAVLRMSDIFVVSATGTMHLCAAVGTPMLSFHSDYTYQCWRPMNPNCVSLKSGDWNSCRKITVDAAWKELEPMIESARKSARKTN